MWDEEIDKAAREMTAGEPGADLKPRVLARIASPRRGATGWLVTSGLSAAAALAILVAILVQPSRQIDRTQDDARAVEVQAAPEARNTPPSGEAASVSRGEPAVVKISAGVERPRVIGAPDIVPGRQARAEELPRAPRATTSAAVPAAAGVVPQETAGDIEPVSIPPLELHPLPEPPPIDIEAVTTEPIELESIDIPAIAQ